MNSCLTSFSKVAILSVLWGPLQRTYRKNWKLRQKLLLGKNIKKPQAKVQKKVLFIRGATHIVKSIGKQWPMVPSIVNPLLESSKNDNEFLALPIDETLYMDMENLPIMTIACSICKGQTISSSPNYFHFCILYSKKVLKHVLTYRLFCYAWVIWTF